MEERRLGPVVGLGTWNTFRDVTTLARAVVDAAPAAGFRLFDTSPMYGSERALAAALAGRGTVATKIWARTRAEGEQQFRDQRSWFARVHIEQIHNLVNWREQLEWLEQEQSIDLLGVTHYSADAFGELAEALRTRRFDVVQLPYNPRERRCEHELLPPSCRVRLARSAALRFPLAHASRRRARLSRAACPNVAPKAVSEDDVHGTSLPGRCAENARAGEPPWFTAGQRALVEELCS